MGTGQVIAGIFGLGALVGAVLLFRHAHAKRHRLDISVLAGIRAFAAVLVIGTIALFISALINR